MKAVENAALDYKNMVYNAHSALRDYWSYENIFDMPIRNVIAEVEFITPKLNEIARRQEQERLKAELQGKANIVMPGRGNRE